MRAEQSVLNESHLLDESPARARSGHALPRLIEQAAEFDGVFPTVGQLLKVVAAGHRPHVRDDEEFAPGLIALKPEFEGLFHEREPVGEFG